MSFITKKHLPRRTFLRGMGVTVALPLLDSMVPAQTPIRKTVAGAMPTRLSCIEMVHGAAGSTGERVGGRVPAAERCFQMIDQRLSASHPVEFRAHARMA